MTWWLFDSARLASEKTAIANLDASANWLTVSRWYANSALLMCVDFSVAHDDAVFAFQMIYPSVFPDAPPMIYTEDKSRISAHQYGADGELCLEYRPDNWQQSIKGAEMIASCQRLLSEERPKPGEVLHADSAHVPSLGRDLRSKYARFLLTKNDVKALGALLEVDPHPLVLRDKLVTSIFVSSLFYIGSKEEPIWISDFVQPDGGVERAGFAIRVPGVTNLGGMDVNEMGIFLANLHLNELKTSLLNIDTWVYLLVGNNEHWTLFLIYGEAEDRKVMRYTTLPIPEEAQRLPDNYSSVSDKTVGLVGCGSVGSKIAASLCRTGIGKFFFIDDDIFFPGNSIRNELDLTDIGTHKTDALRNRLLKINPNADINVLRIALGGQESASSMARALESLGECDLLIDATAEPTVFNMVASVAKRRKKAMIWVEVFSGGIGGIVARARPELDPIPLAARAQIDTWCSDQGVEWKRPVDARHYDGRGGDGMPLIADDAVISIMSAHAARFASDILARPQASIFPVSAYVVGFTSDWLFSQPFDTRPIDLQYEGEWGDLTDTWDPDAAIDLLREHLLPKGGDDAATPAE